jgi:hypothetical protein
LLLVFVAAGCGGGNNQNTGGLVRPPTSIPPSPTPRSTPLPEAPGLPALGSIERPVVILFAATGGEVQNTARQAGNDLEDRLAGEIGITFDVRFVNETEALKAICSGSPTAAWVSAFTYIAAEKQCGAVPVLAVKRGRGARVSIGTTADIVAQSGLTTLSQLRGLTFCRIDGEDDVSWIFPSLLLAGVGVNPITDLKPALDYPDNKAMIRAIYEIKCSAAALPSGEFRDILDQLPGEISTTEKPVSTDDLDNAINVIVPAGDVSLPSNLSNWQGYDTNVIPYEALILSPRIMEDIPKATRDTIIQTIADFFNDRTAGTQRSDRLLSATGVFEVTSASYDAFRTLLTQAKWDMTFTE